MYLQGIVQYFARDAFPMKRFYPVDLPNSIVIILQIKVIITFVVVDILRTFELSIFWQQRDHHFSSNILKSKPLEPIVPSSLFPPWKDFRKWFQTVVMSCWNQQKKISLEIIFLHFNDPFTELYSSDKYIDVLYKNLKANRPRPAKHVRRTQMIITM